MKILVTIAHPAHVHFYKNFMWEMENRGNRISIATSNKDIAIDLLEMYGFDYDIISKRGNVGLKRITDQITHEYNLLKLARRVRPDVITGIGGTAAAHVSKIMHSKSIIFTDSEPAGIANRITFPLADCILTPEKFNLKIGKNHIRYNSFHELAYLHPDYFTPNPEVVEGLGLSVDDTYTVIRFVSWKAIHDIGHKGLKNKIEAVQELERFGSVYITSEAKMGRELEKYRIRISPDKIFDVLSYASLLYSDSQTMTTEAAILGTPAVRCNSFVGENDMSNFIELEDDYGLIFNFKNESEALQKSIEILNWPGVKSEWKRRAAILIDEKIDLTKLMIDLFENGSESYGDSKEYDRTGS